MPDPFHSSYLASGLRGSPFLPHGFGDPAARLERVRTAANRTISPRLLEVLRTQQARLVPSARRREHLDALEKPGTAVVATGQQVGLFLGPLYTFYKAATAVATARLLEKESGVRTVPLFWLQTEDHDFAEIDHCTVTHPGGLLRLALAPDEHVHPRAPVAMRKLGPDVAALLDALRNALDGQPHAQETLALFEAHYRSGERVAAAFAGVLGALFANEGLLVLDPRVPEVAELAAPVVLRALVEHAQLGALLAERAEALSRAGHIEQVRTRRGTPLPFYHPQGPGEARFRLEAQGDTFVLPDGTTRGLDELCHALEREPLSFSSSALLRPLVQDALFPTAAYVGGMAEIDYFAQAAALYPAFALTPPLVVPRARFRLIPRPARRLLDSLALEAAQVECSRAALFEKLPRVSNLPKGAPDLGWLVEFEARLDRFATSVTDPKLRRAVRRTRESARGALDRLVRRDRQTRLFGDATLQDRVTRLQSWLFPDETAQERVLALPWFLAHAGLQPLLERVLAAIDPLAPMVRDLDL